MGKVEKWRGMGSEDWRRNCREEDEKWERNGGRRGRGEGSQREGIIEISGHTALYLSS